MTGEQDRPPRGGGSGPKDRAPRGEGTQGASARPARGGTAGRAGRAPGKRPKKEHGLFFKVFWRTVLGLFALGLLGVVALVVIYLRTPIPHPQANSGKQLSIVYYSDGKTEIGRFSTVNREDVKLARIPKTVQHEFLSAEDRNFYKNPGVSVSGTMRAAWSTLTGGQEQGGSTITQQYVKNYFLTQDRSVKRKVKEIMIAIKIDRKYSKDQVLQDYLNNIYFGRGAYGIQAASQAYFGVDVDKLNPSQGAFLASVINAPGLYDPQYGAAAEARANARMTYVLDGMVGQHWMSASERAAQRMPKFKKFNPNSQVVAGPNGYIVAAVRSELQRKLKLTPEDIDRGGLRITTTIRKSSQKAAVDAVNANVSSQTARLDALHTGLIAEKPDGAIVAMYGGTDVSKSASAATSAQLQGGSSFKAFGLAAALQDGMTMQTRFSGASPLRLSNARNDYVTNDKHEQFGMLTLDRAFAVSSNTAFVRMNRQLGTGKTLGAAQQLGIPGDSPGMKDPGVRDVLGYAAVRVIDMANAYNTISAQGRLADPYFIGKIKSVVGDYSYSADAKTKHALGKDIAGNLVNGMRGPLVDADGTAHTTAGKFQRPAAGKTGTSNSFKSAWFTGFTPNQLTVSVGMYAGNGSRAGTVRLDKATHNSAFYGGDIPATIWLDFMNAALRGQPVAKLPKTTQVTSSTTYSPPVVPPSATSHDSSRATASSTSRPSSRATSTSTSRQAPTSSRSAAPSSTSTTTRSSAPPTPTTKPPVTRSSRPITTPPPASGAARRSSGPPATP